MEDSPCTTPTSRSPCRSKPSTRWRFWTTTSTRTRPESGPEVVHRFLPRIERRLPVAGALRFARLVGRSQHLNGRPVEVFFLVIAIFAHKSSCEKGVRVPGNNKKSPTSMNDQCKTLREQLRGSERPGLPAMPSSGYYSKFLWILKVKIRRSLEGKVKVKIVDFVG